MWGVEVQSDYLCVQISALINKKSPFMQQFLNIACWLYVKVDNFSRLSLPRFYMTFSTIVLLSIISNSSYIISIFRSIFVLFIALGIAVYSLKFTPLVPLVFL